MTRYVIQNCTFREVSDEELTHGLFKRQPKKNHKYIKREKKNGKWVYTYKDDALDKAKKNYENAKSAEANHRIKRDVTLASVNKTMDEINKEYDAKYPKYSDRGSSETGLKFFKETKLYREIADKAKADAKAAEEKLTTAKTAYEDAKKKNEKSIGNQFVKFLNKSSDLINNAKNWIKDKLGYDEKERMYKARDEYEKSKQNYENYKDAVSRRLDDEGLHNPSDERWDALMKTADRRNALQDEKFKKSDEYQKAIREFDKTPLGIYQNISTEIDIASYNAKEAIDKFVEKVDDVAWEVEYGIYSAQKDVDDFLGITNRRDLKEAEDYLKETEKTLENLKKRQTNSYNGAPELDDDIFWAEINLKNAKEKHREAQISYSGSVLSEIESGWDYVSNLFKRKK